MFDELTDERAVFMWYNDQEYEDIVDICSEYLHGTQWVLNEMHRDAWIRDGGTLTLEKIERKRALCEELCSLGV